MSKDLIDKLVDLYRYKLSELDGELKKLGVRYEGMVVREKRYLKEIKQLKTQHESLCRISDSEIKKSEIRYEGMVAREKRYLKEIEQLKAQKESLYRTYSYRLGFLIIHSTKSFKNFVRLPVEFRKLYKENKRRKLTKIQKKNSLVNNSAPSNDNSSEYTALTHALSEKDKRGKQAGHIGRVQIASQQLILQGKSSQNIVNRMAVPSMDAVLELSASVVYRLKEVNATRKAALLFDFFDKDGNRIMSIPGVGVSSAFKQHFRYLNSNSKNIDSKPQKVFRLELPSNVAEISISAGSLGVKDDEQILIKIQGACFLKSKKTELDSQLLRRQDLPIAIVHDPKNKRYTSDLVVASILDEFTAECLSHEVELVKLTQNNWQAQLEEKSPDFLLVESCWRGNDNDWGTLTKGSGGAKKLSGLLAFCKKNGIPTVFWNKEDPPHYDKFGAIAAFFDLAITTDANMVPFYKKDFGIDVYPLSFGAQPKIHNPTPIIPRLSKAVFAGSYYGDKPKRCEDFNEVMRQLELANVDYDIFDRNYHRNIEKFAFPERYQANIVGNLPAEEVWKAHKGYKYQVNMNSVQDSSTMFARRVYESLASGTPVISNDSLGVRELFGDIVIMSKAGESISEQLKILEQSPEAYQELARRGVRAVMREHTYGHRIQTLCHLLGIEVEVSSPKAILVMTASTNRDIERAKQIFETQTVKNKHLFIELENFDDAYKYLNESSDTVTYAMKLGHAMYVEESRYYGSTHVLQHDVNSPLLAESLEDYIYWGPSVLEQKMVFSNQSMIGEE